LVYLYLLLRNIVFESQEKMFKTSVNARPHCPLTSSFYREPDRISAEALYRVPAGDLHLWQYVSIFISFHAIIFFQSRTVGASQTGAKIAFTRNSHSRSFMVVRFCIAEKPTMDCVSLYNNAGLISDFRKIASENAENCRSRQTYCRLTLSQRTSANIRTNLTLPETTVIALQCRRW